MSPVLVDSSVIIDIFTNDPLWADWSENILSEFSLNYTLNINPVIYTEISIGFKRIEELESAVKHCGLILLPIPKESLFLAGKVFVTYRRNRGKSTGPLPDFFIGAHAAVTGMKLITRDTSRIKTYFPSVEVIAP